MRRHRARRIFVNGAVACLARSPRRGVPTLAAHTFVGARAEGPSGGLKSWPSLHGMALRLLSTCGRSGSVSCTLTAARGINPLAAHAVATAGAEEPVGGLKSWPTSHEATLHLPNIFVGARAEEPVGGLRSWPTSHEATPRSPNTCGWRKSWPTSHEVATALDKHLCRRSG